MLLEDVASGTKIETERLVLGNNTGAFLWRDRPTQGEGFRAVRALESQWWRQHRQIHVFSVKQQLDGCTATIMNPTEGEQEPGGQPFRGGQKAISPVPPLFVCVCVCMIHTLLYK